MTGDEQTNVVVRVDETDDVAAPDLFTEGVTVLGEGGGVDDGGCDAFHGCDCERWERGLDFGRAEVVFDETCYEGGFADAWGV